MIVVDSNVISELVRLEPDKNVLRWSHAANLTTLFTTAVCEAEILAGVALMPSGKRREALHEAMQAIFSRSFATRILPFDSHAAHHYAAVVARRTALGRPIKDADAQIAAICLCHGATIATRDTGGFAHLELNIFNPWTD